MSDAESLTPQLTQEIAAAEERGVAGLPQVFRLSLRYAEVVEENRLPEWIDADDEDAEEGEDWEDWEYAEAEAGDEALMGLLDEAFEVLSEMMDRMMLETNLFGEIIAITDMFRATIISGDIA